MLHNVLQYVQPGSEEAERDFPQVMARTYEWLTSLVKPGGAISYANEGDPLHEEVHNMVQHIFESGTFHPIEKRGLESRVVTKPLDSDIAMTAPDQKGGIDLNAAMLSIQERNSINIDPLENDQLINTSINFDGLIPYISEMSPLNATDFFMNQSTNPF